MDFSINLVADNFDSSKDFNCYDRLITIYNEAGIHLKEKKSVVMNQWESNFVDDLLTKVPRTFSDKQKVKIGQIYKRYCM